MTDHPDSLAAVVLSELDTLSDIQATVGSEFLARELHELGERLHLAVTADENRRRAALSAHPDLASAARAAIEWWDDDARGGDDEMERLRAALSAHGPASTPIFRGSVAEVEDWAGDFDRSGDDDNRQLLVYEVDLPADTPEPGNDGVSGFLTQWEREHEASATPEPKTSDGRAEVWDLAWRAGHNAGSLPADTPEPPLTWTRASQSCSACGTPDTQCERLNGRCEPCCAGCWPEPSAVHGATPEGGQPTDPHYPEHAWVWADGNYFDAVVIHREWRKYQQASAERWEAESNGQPSTDDLSELRCNCSLHVARQKPAPPGGQPTDDELLARWDQMASRGDPLTYAIHKGDAFEAHKEAWDLAEDLASALRRKCRSYDVLRQQAEDGYARVCELERELAKARSHGEVLWHVTTSRRGPGGSPHWSRLPEDPWLPVPPGTDVEVVRPVEDQETTDG